MPLADHVGAIACRLEQGGQCRLALLNQRLLSPGGIVNAKGVLSGHQAVA